MTVEVHGYATHYAQERVTVVWNDQLDCWTPAGDVRCPGEGEWHGRYGQLRAPTMLTRPENPTPSTGRQQ